MTWRRQLGIGALAAAVLVGGLATADRLLPPDLSRLTPSRLVVARDGSMLRAFMTPDAQWRLAVTAADVSPAYIHLLLDVEDKRFFAHPGCDPLALLRAAGQLLTHGRVVSGGSTLTMQVARLLEPRPRTFTAKLVQIARAMQLEARMSKAQILDAYLTLAPMGGNLQGVRAGSLAWFGKEPAQLSEADAGLLVALPQSPRTSRPDAPHSRAAAARAKVLGKGARDGLLTQAGFDAAALAPLPGWRLPLPILAPHLAERLAAGGAASAIVTTIDTPIQRAVQQTLHQTLDEIPRPVNVAALVADWRTGEILAEVGSGDYFDATRKGAIDMTQAVRSPGSTLKPFIYGMAFDGLLAHPASLVRDEPTRFDDYAPHNFDGGFNGDVTIRHALQASLNLPAVIVLQRLGPVVFADRFKQVGLPLAFNTETVAPSLPMALGGVGMTLHGLVQAYTALADGGVVKPLIAQPRAERRDVRDDPSLMTRAGADAVVDILSDMPPPKGSARHATTIAYKTGTSYRFRDGWALGFDGSRVIGVWMGRADGGTCSGCVGVASAGILFRLFDLLPPDPLPRRMQAPIFAGPAPASLVRLTNMAATPVAGAPHITFPLPGSRLLVDVLEPDSAIKLAVDGGRRPYRWLVDGRPVTSRPFAHEAVWHPVEDGFSTVTVVDAAGQSDEVKVRIETRAPLE
ncbi:penicillin-binding protein 1C [Beijerinckia sp. L45]|uniref:penicillin-binding protein 1C n=1 Tax=Beijerinckia sp. L45 TaxID=1641855 RepID=UPI00131AC610|nr:penicillin-binding protein 1C [Beijerinckia sp. L45]